MWLSLCCGCQSAVRTTSVISDQRPRRQCGIAAAVGLAVLLACSLASRPTQAQGQAQASSRGPHWPPRTPHGNPARHTRHAASRVPARQPTRQPWQNPCGTSVAVAPMTTPTRHPRPHRPIKNAHDLEWPSPSMEALGGGLKGWSLRTVRRRIRIARAHLRHRRRHIFQVYGPVKEFSKKYAFDWLPQEQVPWYRAEVTCLDRDSQAAQVLPALRSALQNFSATFVELQKARKWTIDQPGLGNRTLIINELASHVKGMLCEVETAMQDRALPLPAAGLPVDGLAGVDASRWNQEPDQTGALLQDWGVVSAYTEALYGWALILRELGHAPKVRRAEGQAGPGQGPGGRSCPSEPHRLHGGLHGGRGRQRNQLRRKQRGHPGGPGGPGGPGAGGEGDAAKQEARRKRRRRRRKQRERRERQRMRRRLMEEMARQRGQPWRRPAQPAQHGARRPRPHGPKNFS